MRERIAKVLARYEERQRREDPIVAAFSAEEYLAQRDSFLLGIGAASGEFLNILIKAVRPRLVVEAGAAYGYSTLWLADAAQQGGGRVMSYEVSEAKIGFARGQLEEAGLDGVVEFVHGDALEKLASLDKAIDFALIDLWKELYVPVLDCIYPKLASGALIAADNVCLPALHAPKMQAYVTHVRSLAGMQSVTVPVGSGIELSRYTNPLPNFKENATR